MFRKYLDENKGMFFVFEKPQKLCFWMKNTYIPLSIAFLDENLNITNIADMQPLSLVPVCSQSDAQFALEMNQYFFQNHNFQEKENLFKLLDVMVESK